jgi:hypothetical protein
MIEVRFNPTYENVAAEEATNKPSVEDSDRSGGVLNLFQCLTWIIFTKMLNPGALVKHMNKEILFWNLCIKYIENVKKKYFYQYYLAFIFFFFFFLFLICLTSVSKHCLA